MLGVVLKPLVGVQGVKPPKADEFLHVKGDFLKTKEDKNIRHNENVFLKKIKGGGGGRGWIRLRSRTSY
jgi:hypothetical protein